LLLEMKHLTPELVKKMEDQLRAEIDEAVAFAESSPVPSKDDILQDVYG
jgi:pyruvate dehydrogenase E1 component alpha subunit